jgi:hypothetical protein
MTPDDRVDGNSDGDAAASLFRAVNAPDTDSRYNAHVNADEPVPGPGDILLVGGGPNQWSTYAEGYKALADMGVQHAFEDGQPVDTLVYSVLFGYRHYLELRLKELITTGGDLLDQELVRPTNHRLPELWRAVRPLLERIWSKESLEEDAEQIDRVVREFAAIDPQSMSFRYPVDTQGNRSLPGLKYINLKRVKDAIDEVAPTLDGASIAIDEWLDTKAETMAEYRAEMRAEYGGDMEYYAEH